MIIERIEITNFMSYKGYHEIDFSVSDSSPIIIFLGENGHGKSTIHNASKWCLYDKCLDNPNADLINRKVIKEETHDDQIEMVVKMICVSNGNKYSLTRSWKPYGDNPTKTQATLRINNGDPVTEIAIQNQVRNLLAEEVSHFVFFDGETQKEFDAMAYARGPASSIKSEIENTLSIPAISKAVTWFKENQATQSQELIKINVSNDKVKKAGEELAKNKNTKKEYAAQVDLVKLTVKKHEQEIELIHKRFGNLEESQSLHEDISGLEGALKNQSVAISDSLENISRKLSGNVFWAPLAKKLENIRVDLTKSLAEIEMKENKNSRIESEIQNLTHILEHRECPVCKSTTRTTDEETKEKITKLSQELEIIEPTAKVSISKKLDAFKNFGYNYNSYLDLIDDGKRYNTLIADRSSYLSQLDTKRRALSSLGNPNIQALLDSLELTTAKKQDAEEDLNELNKSLEEINKKIAKSESEVAKGVSKDKRVELDSYRFLIDIFEKSKEEYTIKIKDRVEEVASTTFLKMISDSKYTGLKINDNFGIELVLPDGKTDALKSTGQGKVSTISLISGLIKTAMSEASILMDTPVVSLDTTHREKVYGWAATSGLKVSFFMHSGEFNLAEDMKYFNSTIGKIYRIRKIDDDQSEVVLEELI